MKTITTITKTWVLLLALLAGTGQLLATEVGNTTNVKVLSISPRELKIVKSYVGHLEPAERVEIRTEASGTVEKIAFEEGELVGKEKILVHISTRELEMKQKMAQTQYNQAMTEYKAQKNQFIKSPSTLTGGKSKPVLEHISTSQLRLQEQLARSRYEFALDEYKTQKTLHDKQLISDTIIDKYANAVDVSRIQLAQVSLNLAQSMIVDASRMDNFINALEMRRINLSLADLELEKSKIRAPFKGIVRRKIVQPGAFVQKGSPILELMDISKVLARINIPEREIRFMRLGEMVTIQLDALPGVQFKGRIKTVGLEADMKSRCFPAEIEIDNAQQMLLPGMMARVELTAKSKQNQIIVPRHAVLERERGSLVYIVENGRAVRKSVQTGDPMGENIQIVGGLDYGDRLIIVGQDLLTNNERVRIVNSNNKIARR